GSLLAANLPLPFQKGRIRPLKKPPAPSSWRNLSGVSPPEPCPHRQASQRHPLPARWRELRSPPPGAEHGPLGRSCCEAPPKRIVPSCPAQKNTSRWGAHVAKRPQRAECLLFLHK